jgi:hypothetical protein
MSNQTSIEKFERAISLKDRLALVMMTTSAVAWEGSYLLRKLRAAYVNGQSYGLLVKRTELTGTFGELCIVDF